MTTIIAEKTAPVGGKTQFRTQTVNGKPQIYFDAIDESSAKSKPKRPIRAVATTRLPEQLKPKPSNQKSPSQNFSNKPTKRANKVTFNDDQSTDGVFMTMEEISELVKAVKESNQNQNNRTMIEHTEPTPPPIQYQEPPPPPPPQSNEIPMSYEIPPVPLAPISPRQEALGMMAEKKRQKWMREKAEMDRMKLEVEYDQLKHQLSPIHQKAASSPERSDYSSANKPPLPPSVKPNDDVYKQRLIEKKQQQWKQENAEKAPVWNPFGRPGAGAPNANEIQTQTLQQPSNNVMPYRPPEVSSAPDAIVLNDQTRVPAAMRTNLLFGDVRFEDDVKSAKEIERRRWLEDLQKQIEDNKRNKFTQQETERRHDFLQENIQPLVHEAPARHHPQMETSPLPSSQTLTTTHTGKDMNRSSRHDSVVQQTYDKIVEATELAKYEKKAQLIEKLKRNGHKTDLLARTLPDMKNISPVSNQKSNEKSYESSTKQITTITTTKIEPLQLNVGNDPQHSYRTNDVGRRDEAVNTIDSTFRSDHSVQTDLRMPPHRQMFAFAREESDLPPQIPNHLLKNPKLAEKKVRIRSLEDPPRQRQSHSHVSIRDDGAPSQRSTAQGPVDLLHRPLWNYHNPQHREYVPNSKRDPHYDKRQRPQDRSSRIDEVPKKTSYNRWNSDSQLQNEQNEKKMNVGNRTRSMGMVKRKDEPIINVFKSQKPRQDTFVITTEENQQKFSNISSLDRYEHFTPYIRTDEVLDPARAFSPVPQSRETSAHRPPRATTVPYDNNQRRQNPTVQPPPYHVPPARQEHILQQLTAIKENLVRRQQEVASSMNAIPV